jgi:hypothetical protein
LRKTVYILIYHKFKERAWELFVYAFNVLGDQKRPENLFDNLNF